MAFSRLPVHPYPRWRFTGLQEVQAINPQQPPAAAPRERMPRPAPTKLIRLRLVPPA